MQIPEIRHFAQTETVQIGGRVCRVRMPLRTPQAELIFRQQAASAAAQLFHCGQQDNPVENGRNVKKTGSDCEI